jgi:DHA1 family multidrug resistance protein-like MFS transporter
MVSTTTATTTPTGSLFSRPVVRRLLVIALLAEIGYAVLNVSTMPVYLKYDRHFGESVIGLVLVAFLFAEAVFKGPMGHLADKFGPKALMIAGPAISFGSALLSLGVPHNLPQPIQVLAFVLLRALDGLAAAMLWPAAFSAMNDAVEDRERQQAMSLLNLCYMLGIALAFPVGGIVNDLAGERWAGLVLATALFAGVSLAVWRLLPRVAPHHEHVEAGEAVSIQDFLVSMRRIPSYLILAVVTFAGVGFPMAIFKLFPKDQFGYTETQIGLLVFPGAIAMALASVPMSKLGERLGRARAVHFGLGLSGAGMAVIGSGMLVPMLRHPLLLAFGAIPVGIGFLMTIPAWMASVSDIDPQRRGTNIGAIMTAQGIGAILGAPIGSTLYEKLQPVGVQLGLGEAFGRYSPFAGCAACILAGWLISLKLLHDPK